MVEASELRRLAYLQALGVDSYVSRETLPAAAVSRRLRVVTRAPITAVPNAPPAIPDIVDLGLDVRSGGQAKPAPPPVAPVKSAPEAMESFTIAAIVAGGWLWLEELPRVALASEQVQLISAMVRALGLPQTQPAVAQFDWPIHTNQQFDLGPDAASSGLQGFVQRQLTDFAVATVVLLGDECRQRLPTQLAIAERLVNTVSTRSMIGEPMLKRQAWRDLRPYASDQ